MSQGSAPTATESVVNIYPDNHIEPPLSHALVWPLVIAWITCLTVASRRRAQALRTAADADAGVNEGAPLAAGAKFISGVVEYAEGETRAVEVHVEQRGSEYRVKNGVRHKWSEVARETHAHPFYVRRPDGLRVRVEPGSDVFLVDEPDEMDWTERTRRTRIARLTPGENVIVEGELHRAHDPEVREATYRTDGRGWVMRPPSDYPLHVSTEPLGVRHRLRAKAFRNAIIGLCASGLVSHAAIASYYARVFTGWRTTADVVKTDFFTTRDSKNRPTTHYRVFLSVAWPEEVTLDRELDFYDWQNVRKGQSLYFRHVTYWPWASNPGTGSSLHAGALLIALLGALGSAVVYIRAQLFHRWYEGKLEDDGSGELPFPPIPGPPIPGPPAPSMRRP